LNNSATHTGTEYIKIDTSLGSRDIVEKVQTTPHSALMIPPRFDELELETDNLPDTTRKMVGLFSSGSTGTPKCIWNYYDNLLHNAAISQKMFDISAGNRLLIIASPWHVAGLSWCLMAEQARARYKIITPKIKDSDQWVDEIRAVEPDYLFTVPTVLRYLYKAGNWNIPAVAYGGASIEPKDYHDLKKHCKTVYQAYGQTEAGGLIAVHKRPAEQSPDPHEHQCCGYPPLQYEIICDGTSEYPQPIYLHSPTSIYDGSYNTGDLGYKDSHGRLYISGRTDEQQGNCNMITAVTSVAHK